MSCKIHTQFAVREVKIMEDTLEKLGFSFTKSGNQLVLKNRDNYNNVSISESKITYDRGAAHDVENIKSEYQRNVEIARLDEEGSLYEVEETREEITIFVA